MLSGTNTAPIRVSATAICTHRTQFGMIRPTRVPLVTPAAMNVAASARLLVSSSA